MVDETDRRYAATLAKGLQVLRAFSQKDPSLGNREIARRTGLHSSTVSRLTYTLAKHGFLVQLQPSEAFRLGPAAIALGYTARESFSFLSLADPLMQALADDVSALVAVGVQDGDAVMLARVWRPVGRAAIWLQEGHRLPLDRSAAGRAIMALAPQGPDDSPQTNADRQALLTRGCVDSIGSWNEDVNACAVPFVPDQTGLPFAFLCGAMKSEMDATRLSEQVGPKLITKVNALKALLGLAH
ncbi:IclR family transcriptional regulator [Loktanella agnita]|uniref:IclR family transcriptional regulator n=1 Tax=Loktanella agnita TaxID=287097 RepID=UPI003987DE6F